MNKLKRLGGWWRLWIVLSAVWMVGVASVADWTQPDSVVVKSWPFSDPSIDEVNDARRTLCTTDQTAFLSDFKGPGDLVMPTAVISQTDDRNYVVQLQCHERYGFARRVRDNLITMLALPLGLLFIGLAFLWVRGGFKRNEG